MGARRIAGITVEIGGDTTKLTTALKDVDKALSTTQSSLRDVNKLLKLDPGNTELLAQKHRLLGEAVSETKEKLATLKTAAEQANQALASGEITQSQYDALQREIIETGVGFLSRHGLVLLKFSEVIARAGISQGGAFVGNRYESGTALGLLHQRAEDGGEVLLAHELLHLGNRDEGFLENVVVSALVCGLDHGLLICVLAVGACSHQLEALPNLPVVDGGVLGVGLNLTGPLGEIVQLSEDALAFFTKLRQSYCAFT